MVDTKIEIQTNRIIKTLEKYIQMINIELSFVGLHAKIAEKKSNRIIIYDLKTLKPLMEKTINTYPLFFELNFKEGTVEYYSKEFEETSIHTLIIKGASVIAVFDKNNQIKEIKLSKYNQFDDYELKELVVENNHIHAIVDSHIFGSEKENGERSLSYYETPTDEKSTFMIESSFPQFGFHKQICVTKKGIHTWGVEINRKVQVLDKMSKEDYQKYSECILLHPRNKELITYVEGEFEQILPGISNYLETSFPLYKHMKEAEYKPDPLMDNLIKEAIDNKCDIKVLSKKREDN